MTTKQARAIVNGMTARLEGPALDDAVLAALAKANMIKSDMTQEQVAKLRDSIINEYRQHAWDVEDKGISTKNLASLKPAKKAAKKATKKPVAKKAKKAKKTNGPSRVSRMFHHVLAGMSNEQALAAIRKEFGANVETNLASIGWVRSQLRAKSEYAAKYNPNHKIRVKTNNEITSKK